MVNAHFFSAAALDIAITITICHKLARAQGDFSTTTKRLIVKCIRLSMTTAAFTSSIALATVILILANNRHSYASLPFSFILPRVYAISVRLSAPYAFASLFLPARQML